MNSIDQYDEKTRRDIETFRTWADECAPGKMVFFGGAGVSTESGIPDFRSQNGLYHQKYKYPPETIISRTFFDRHPEEFFDFYCDRMLIEGAEPNRAHKKLAELEKRGTLSAVITQNIDGLHQAAGSHHVYELHGSVLRNYCMRCGEAYTVEGLLAARAKSIDGVPRCGECSGIIKPDVVLYEEGLDMDTLEAAVSAIEQADLMLVAGTSLVVYPAAGLLQYFSGKHLVIANLSPTSADKNADLCIAAKIGDVMDW